MMLVVVCVGVFSLSLWLQVSRDKGDRKDRDLHEDLWFELSDETLCNWMMFVRPAQNHLEQNLVAYQYGHHVYYTTIKNVEPKQELKVQHWGGGHSAGNCDCFMLFTLFVFPLEVVFFKKTGAFLVVHLFMSTCCVLYTSQFYLFMWLHWVFFAVRGLFLVAEHGL